MRNKLYLNLLLKLIYSHNTPILNLLMLNLLIIKTFLTFISNYIINTIFLSSEFWNKPSVHNFLSNSLCYSIKNSSTSSEIGI